jgi:hypothetical protein
MQSAITEIVKVSASKRERERAAVAIPVTFS